MSWIIDFWPILYLIPVIVCLFYGFRKKKGSKIPRNTVCLHQVGRGPLVPSLSPFALKLETFLRMHKIPYMNDHSGTMSKKGKTPWITYNGKDIADSQMCIEYLKDKRNLRVDDHLSREEKAVARAIRCLTEENLYWTMCYETFVKNPKSLDLLLKDIFSRPKIFVFKNLVGRLVKKELHGHGIGRHSDTEIWSIGKGDLTALSEFLGDKNYMFGDKASDIDCTVFGMLSMAVWQMKGSRHEAYIHQNLPNLVAYCERMKESFWRDWSQRCRGPGYVQDDLKMYSF
ncbi:failed axon connections homolog isoform X2 [Biomphalaria glabrata]|uniref:Failed axon connections homolog isoform X2 n=1 Tax=Biomphalaria glabrata TaxID=6526 RepID=A0A2C9JRQ5_BIOGL|nr:failed axon connections homolog isoform X2 [Biomphalaria glabrata]KAI8789724.1 failed axon connections isoform X2 [Biomphalaria glabrata]